MNETEKQIVAWLRNSAGAYRSAAEAFSQQRSPSSVANETIALSYERAADVIERGGHRDKQDG